MFLIRMENKKGIRILAIMTTQSIPIIEMNAIDRNAGCRAKIKTPNPAMVVIADKKMEDLNEERFLRPVLYSCSRPSIIKRL